MLLDNFYLIRSYESSDLSLKASLEFILAHPIFKGHFPTVPVVPGVCMMQIVKEVFEKITGQKVRFAKVPMMKFLTPINPLVNASVQIQLAFTAPADNDIQVNASLFNENVVYFKFKGIGSKIRD